MEGTRFSLARHVKLGVETQPRGVVQPHLFRFGKRIRLLSDQASQLLARSAITRSLIYE